jgi:hypothetical protein
MSDRANQSVLFYFDLTFKLCTQNIYLPSMKMSMMNEAPQYLKTIDPWCFSIYIAQRELIREALPEAVGRFRSVTYVYYNPGMRLFIPDPRSDIQCIQIMSYDELVNTIVDSKSSLLLIQYSEEWFIDCPDLILEFGRLCRAYTWNKGAVALLSVRMNYGIRCLHSSIKTIKWIMGDQYYLPGQDPGNEDIGSSVREYEQQMIC